MTSTYEATGCDYNANRVGECVWLCVRFELDYKINEGSYYTISHEKEEWTYEQFIKSVHTFIFICFAMDATESGWERSSASKRLRKKTHKRKKRQAVRTGKSEGQERQFFHVNAIVLKLRSSFHVLFRQLKKKTAKSLCPYEGKCSNVLDYL